MKPREPKEARWPYPQAHARQPDIGELVDDAMSAVEQDNPVLKDVLPKEYARPALDKRRLGQLIDLIGNIKVGDKEARSKDVLGRVYEYFLSQFASAEGKRGGEFYTARSVGEVTGGDAGALSRPGLRSLLRLVRHVRPFEGIHRCPRHRKRERRPCTSRYFHLRSRVKLHHLATGQNEPGYPRQAELLSEAWAA